jgi:hypothetical protein
MWGEFPTSSFAKEVSMRKLLLLLCVLSLAACAASPKAKGIQEADSQMVADCISLGSVEAYSGWGGCLCQGVGSSSAKNQALNKAAKLDATHIVWSDQKSGFMGAKFTGQAYRCH